MQPASTSCEDRSDEVGPYRIEAEIGAGGMGKVYRAYDQRLGRRVALKRMRSRASGDPRIRARFLREARAAALVNHPTVVQIFDIFEEDGRDWIVMELAEGETLARVLETGPLDLDRTLAMALELTSGLAAAHAQGVVHRDLKARNIVVTAEGHVKILDFGLAKRLDDEDEQITLTWKGQILGTPGAMSPEQARGWEVDHRSDLFSLGTLLYQMLTGVSPFVGPNFWKTVQRICTHRQIPVRKLRAETPRRLSNLIDRLLEKDPRNRPQSAREAERELRELSHCQAGPGLAPSAFLRRSGRAADDEETLDEAAFGRRTDRRQSISTLTTASNPLGNRSRKIRARATVC